MGVNRALEHLLILPEDEATSLLAQGFADQLPGQKRRQMQVLPFANGWPKVLKQLQEVYVPQLLHYPAGRLLAVIDFDENQSRVQHFYNSMSKLSHTPWDRIFILGPWTQAENLRKQAKLGNFQAVGAQIYADAVSGSRGLWQTYSQLHYCNQALHWLPGDPSQLDACCADLQGWGAF